MSDSSISNNSIAAAYRGVALYDLTDWGKIAVGGEDRLRFLHNQSTADFLTRTVGTGCDTVFVTSTARTIDLATARVRDNEVLLLVSPERRKYLFDWLDRYIFVADRVTLTDVTENFGCLTIIGPESDRLLTELGGGDLVGRSIGDFAVFIIDNISIEIAVGSGLTLPGYQLIFDAAYTEQLTKKILELDAISLSTSNWERLRIEQGRPAPDRELTEDYNPLEVGLWQTISFNKGCYIGQETIARLNTYKGVKQYLWGIKFTTEIPVGTALTIDGDKIGVLTSITQTNSGWQGLAYIKAKSGGVGLKVNAENAIGEIIDIPFVSHEYPII